MSIKIYQKSIISDPNLMPEVEEFLLGVVADVHLSDEQLNYLTLSVAEATSNCIVHGNKLNPSKNIFIKISIDENSITICLKDEGKGFMLENVPNPTTPENILKDNGRGIHIMKTFLTDLQYNFTPTGTEAILVLKYK
ncbi:MAG: ATP-binding protein [bacterium]